MRLVLIQMSLTGLKTKTLQPVRSAPLIEADYRARLERLTAEMCRSTLYWVRAAYRRDEPELASLLAQDDSPALSLRRVVRRLARRWQRRFDELAPELATHFATAVKSRSDVALARNLRKGGMSVRFKTTRAVNDVLQASIAENVSLIRSIPQRYFSEIEGMVMRSVQVGRDLKTLTEDLERQYHVTHRRAALIARDQNNKCTAVIQRTRQAELGITEAIWVHSHGGKTPRPTHVRAGRDQIRYNIAEGWLDPALNRRIWPGTEINCRCIARPIVLGFS